MRNIRLSSIKYLKKLIIVFIGFLILFYGLSYGFIIYADYLADPINQEADYPDNAFQSLYDDYEVRGTNLKVGLKDVSGSNLEKRLRVSSIGLMDSAMVGGEIIAALQQSNGTSTKYIGRNIVLKCGSDRDYEDSFTSCRRDTLYPATFSTLYKGWLDLALAMEGANIADIYRNETARKTLTNYIKRAKFYDSYLMPQFEMKPLEAVYYTSNSGLYIIGQGDEPVYIDGKKIVYDYINTSKKADWRYIDVRLQPGYHEIRKDGFSVQMPVYGSKPKFATRSNGSFVIVGFENKSAFFKGVVIEGENWSEEFEWTGDQIQPELPGKPNYVSFVRGNFSVTEAVNKGGVEEHKRTLNGEAFGMSEEEYDRFIWISKRFESLIEILPGISSPGERNHDLQTHQPIS